MMAAAEISCSRGCLRTEFLYLPSRMGCYVRRLLVKPSIPSSNWSVNSEISRAGSTSTRASAANAHSSCTSHATLLSQRHLLLLQGNQLPTSPSAPRPCIASTISPRKSHTYRSALRAMTDRRAVSRAARRSQSKSAVTRTRRPSRYRKHYSRPSPTSRRRSKMGVSRKASPGASPCPKTRHRLSKRSDSTSIMVTSLSKTAKISWTLV